MRSGRNPAARHFDPIAQGCTGMKKFDHNKPYPAYSPGAFPINFAQVGNAFEYLNQCNDGQGGGTGAILNQLTNRAFQCRDGSIEYHGSRA